MNVRVVLSIEIDSERWAQANECDRGDVRGQVCASVVNCVAAEFEDYGATVRGGT